MLGQNLRIIYQLGKQLEKTAPLYVEGRIDEYLNTMHQFLFETPMMKLTQPTIFGYDISRYKIGEIDQLISEKIDTAASRQIPPPFISKNNIDTESRARNPKILFIMPLHTGGDETKTKNPNIEIFYDTATQQNIDTDLYPSDSLILTPNSADLPDDLKNKINAFKPDAIFIAVDGKPNEENGLCNTFIENIKSISSAKIICQLGDFWHRSFIGIAQYWSKHSDLNLIINPTGLQFISDKFACFPSSISSKRSIILGDDKRDYDWSFMGRHHGLRTFYAATAQKYSDENNFQYFSKIHHKKMNETVSEDEYYDISQRSKIILNTSLREDFKTTFYNGRSAMAFHCGNLLLEEENPETRFYYHPFVHYVPYSNMTEMKHFMRYFLENPDKRLKIAEAGYRFTQEHYSAKNFWNFVCNLMDK